MTKEEIERKIFDLDFKRMKDDLHWVELIDDGSRCDVLKDTINELLDLLIELKEKEKIEVLEEEKIKEITLDVQRDIGWNLWQIEDRINILIKAANELKRGA